MAKKQQTPRPKPQVNNPQAARAQAATRTADTTSGAGTGVVQRYMGAIILAAIALFTFIVYKGSLENQFTNWDDLGYVLTNPLIKTVRRKVFGDCFTWIVM